ncbi:MAG: type III-B CRISPR module RAMP protein Cmr1 [candidate division WOR-3 bacterium]
MYPLSLKCKTITPMFMAGADGKSPELRPSEFKGMIRWWWRAIKAESDINKLKKEEAEIFGGTGKNEGKSKLWIRISTHLSDSDVIKYQPLPHHKRVNCPICGNSWCNKAFELKAIKKDKEISLEFAFIDDKDPKMIESLIYLTFILGGFGKRARRGFGSLQIIEPQIKLTPESILNFLNNVENSYEIGNSDYLQGNRVIKNKKNGGNYPWIKEIILGTRSYIRSDDILVRIGEASHKYSDPSLGLAKPRMTSSVYVSVIKDDDKYYPLLTLLNFAPPKNYTTFSKDKQTEFIDYIIR